MKLLRACVVAAAAVLAAPAVATPVVLDFEGVGPYPSAPGTYMGYNTTTVGGFYSGGTSGAGTSGPNHGVTFSANALGLCLNTPGIICSNTSRGGFGSAASQTGALYFASGTSIVMNVAGGFGTGFAFFYADADAPGASVSVYDGPNATGNVLATLNLGLTPGGGCAAAYSGGARDCPFAGAGASFAGTAYSVEFVGTPDFIVFDDVTLGSAIPGAPEPASWALMITGFGAVGLALRRRLRASVRYG